MNSEDKLTFSLPIARATRGETIKVRLSGDRSPYRSVRVELLQVERKPKAVLDAKSNNAVVVQTIDVTEAQGDVELPIPANLPNQYSGTQVGWDYEVRLVGDRPKRGDHEVVEAINIDSRVPIAGTDNSLQSLCTSRAASLAGLGEDAHDKSRSVAVPFAVVGVVAVLIGMASDDPVWLIAGVVTLLLAAFGWFNMHRAAQHSIADVEFERTQKVVRLGEPVVMKVDNAIGHTLEAGVQAIEISIEQGSKRSYGIQHVAYEHWTPVTGTTVSIPTPVDQVAGYVGEQLAVHWVAVLRKAEGADTVKNLSARTVHLAVTH